MCSAGRKCDFNNYFSLLNRFHSTGQIMPLQNKYSSRSVAEEDAAKLYLEKFQDRTKFCCVQWVSFSRKVSKIIHTR